MNFKKKNSTPTVKMYVNPETRRKKTDYIEIKLENLTFVEMIWFVWFSTVSTLSLQNSKISFKKQRLKNNKWTS